MILAIIGAGVAGLVIGLVSGMLFFRMRNNSSELKQDLAKAQAGLKEYQQQVTEHISKTNEMIQKIYAQCDALQNHVHEGTQQLNRDSSRQSLLQPSSAEAGSQDKPEALTDTNSESKAAPPKDYAPEK